MSQQSMLNELSSTSNRRQSIQSNEQLPSNSSMPVDMQSNKSWGIWSQPVRSPFGTEPLPRYADESPFDSQSVQDGWTQSRLRRNSTLTDPQPAATQPQQAYQSVFRSSSFSGQAYGSSPTYRSFRQGSQVAPPPGVAATSPQYYNQQPTNILERFQQVAEATREAEFMNSAMKNMNLNEQYQPQQTHPSIMAPMGPRSDANSPPQSYRSDPRSPYMSPTPQYGVIEQRSSHASRSNSMTSAWRDDPNNPAALFRGTYQQQQQQLPPQQHVHQVVPSHPPHMGHRASVDGDYDGFISQEEAQRLAYLQNRTSPPHNHQQLPTQQQIAGVITPPLRSNSSSRGSISGGPTGIYSHPQNYPQHQRFPSTSRPVGLPLPSQQPQQSQQAVAPAPLSPTGPPASQALTSGFAGFTRDGMRYEAQNLEPRASSSSAASNGPSHSRSSSSRGNKSRRESDFASIRSPLLEEFRTNKSRKYELKDLYGHIVEFSGDQHGSRFIQQSLENASTEEKDVIFDEIRSNALQLMTDVFGNYVIQKFFELGNQMQKTMLAKQMEGNILSLSLQMYGCRVVQKAIEHVLTDQQALLIKELDGHVLKCVKDQNGNHVIQKAIERIPGEHIAFILNAFQNQVYQLATHPYGCRVIQRMLEHSDDEAQQKLLGELHSYTQYLVEDQYGNYVIQHVVQRGRPADRERIIEIVRDSVLQFSRHKYASNVVEKCIMCSREDQRSLLIDEILRPGQDGAMAITAMMRDQYANYVIQKLLEATKGRDHDRLVAAIKPQLHSLKKYSYGKHLISIEKLLNKHSAASGSGSPTLFDAPPDTEQYNATSDLPSSAVAASTDVNESKNSEEHDDSKGQQ